MRAGHWILNGQQPVATDLMTWAEWMEKAERHVARDVIGESEVSTVFLGLDHNFSAGGPPILFETMVFGGKMDGHMERYATWAEAERGHRKVVEQVKQPDVLDAEIVE